MGFWWNFVRIGIETDFRDLLDVGRILLSGAVKNTDHRLNI
jgi:hypothetical protein